MDVRAGLLRKLSAKELMLLNCGVGEDFESLLNCKEILPVHPKEDHSWVFIGKTDVETETPILGHLMQRADSFERPWFWERLKTGGEGDDSGWDGWMASLTQWTWVWVKSGSWWWIGRPGVLHSMGSQRVGHDWVTELKSCTAQQVTTYVYCHLNVKKQI